jgi:hypothetical protein
MKLFYAFVFATALLLSSASAGSLMPNDDAPSNSASGETDLGRLIKSMRPSLNDGEYVFISMTDAGDIPMKSVVCMFRETEGVTLILEKQEAERLALQYTSSFAWITLTVHSSLEATGLTAAFSTALARANIGCNVVAAYYHDHIFVPFADANRAIDVLRELSDQN